MLLIEYKLAQETHVLSKEVVRLYKKAIDWMNRYPDKYGEEIHFSIVPRGGKFDFLKLPENLHGIDLEFKVDKKLPKTAFNISGYATIKNQQSYVLSRRITIIISIGTKLAKVEAIPNIMPDLVPEINDVLRHELEHVYQSLEKLKASTKGKEQDPGSTDYYSQKVEIDAHLAGIYRYAKHEKIPFVKALMIFFERVSRSIRQKEGFIARFRVLKNIKRIYLQAAIKRFPTQKADLQYMLDKP